MVKVVHEAPPVHQRREIRKVPADPGVETSQLGDGGVVQARDLPVRKLATKQEVWHTLRLQLRRIVEVAQVEIMLIFLAEQAGLVPLPGLPRSLHGGLDEFSQRGEIETELSGETGQSEHTELRLSKLDTT